MKVIEITFNDDTKKAEIDYLAAKIYNIIKDDNVTATVLVQEVDIPDECSETNEEYKEAIQQRLHDYVEIPNEQA